MEAESDSGNGVLRYDRMSDIDKGEQTVYYIKHDIKWKVKKYPKKEAGYYDIRNRKAETAGNESGIIIFRPKM